MAKIIKHKMKWEAVMMTPEWAQQLLDRMHPSNRRTKTHKIPGYRRDMESGNWHLTPNDAICISTNNWTINGNNRLTACVQANVEVPMVICTGCDEEAMLGMDLGSTRNFADYLKITGKDMPGTGANNFASVVRSMHRGIMTRYSTLTNAEVIAFGEQHQAALEFCFECLPINKRGITQASVRAVIARAYYKRNCRSRTKEFCAILYDGLANDVQKDSGALRLRNWIIDTFLGGIRKARTASRPTPAVIYAKTERALEAFHEGEHIQALVEKRKELFPIPNEPVEEPAEEVSVDGVLETVQ